MCTAFSYSSVHPLYVCVLLTGEESRQDAGCSGGRKTVD